MRRTSRPTWSPGNSPSIRADICSRIWSVMGSTRALYRSVSSIEQRLQAAVDRLAGAEDARTHRSHRAIHGLGDLLVTQSLDLAQDDRRAQVFRQRPDGVAHRAVNLVRQGDGLGRVAVTHARLDDRLLGLAQVGLVVEWPPLPGRHGIARGVHGDAVQPR